MLPVTGYRLPVGKTAAGCREEWAGFENRETGIGMTEAESESSQQQALSCEPIRLELVNCWNY